MKSIAEELTTAGVVPAGPVSAWPIERHQALMERLGRPPTERKTTPIANSNTSKNKQQSHDKKVKAGIGRMAGGVLKTAGAALTGGKVTAEIRNERYETCKACPHFIEESKRCSECGCFMEAKTWINADKDWLCPKQKWER